MAKRIDILAAALHAHMTVEDLTRLDLSYTPPVSAPWDPLQAAADTWEQARSVGRGVAGTRRLAEREGALPDE